MAASNTGGRTIAWFAARDPFRPVVRTGSLAPVASFNGIIVILGLVFAYALQVMFRAAEPPPAAYIYVPATALPAGGGAGALLLGSGVPMLDSSASEAPLGAFVAATMAAFCAALAPPGATPSYSARAYNTSAAPVLVAVGASGEEARLPLVSVVRTPAASCPALWLSVSFTYDFSVAPAGTVVFCARTPPLLIAACVTCPPGEDARSSYGVSRVAGASDVEVCVPAGRVAESIAFTVDTRVELSGPSTILTPVLRAVLLPVGATGAVHPARGGNVTITSLPSIAVLVAVPSPPSVLNVAALVGAFVLSSISAVGRVLTVALSTGVQSRVKRVVAATHASLLLRAVLVSVAIGLPWVIGVLMMPTFADLVLGKTLFALYFTCCALLSFAVLLHVGLACRVWVAPEAVARARRVVIVACAVVSVMGLPTAFTIFFVNAGRLDGPSGINMLYDLVTYMSLPGLVAAALMALVVHETTTARGEVMIASNQGCASIGLLWMWGAAVCTLAYAVLMSSVAEVVTALVTAPLETLLCLSGLIACYMGLGTTLFARMLVSADTESSLRRGALLLLLANCAIASVVSATATLIWLVVNATNGLPLGNILFSTWMLVCMVAAAAWASHVFIAVDAGRWRGDDDAVTRGERVVAMMNPVRVPTTAPVVHSE